MADKLEYRVIPAEPPDPPSFAVKASPWGVGCILMFVALIITVVIDLYSNLTANLSLFFSLEVAAVILASIFYSTTKEARRRAAIEEWRQQKIAEHSSKALELTQRARQTMDMFFVTLRSLPSLLRDTDNLLSHAEEEFDGRAYAPFWDNIEQAALRLGVFNSSLARLEAVVESYKCILHGQVHNFPPLAVQSGDIPSPARQAESLRQLVRMGQTNFEFATIWEHRKTQAAIMEGFRTLGDAVNNLGLRIDDSLSRVTKTISESSTRQQEEQLRLRETFEDAVRKWEEWEEQKQLYRA